MTQDNDLRHGEKIVIHIEPELEELIPGYIENRHKDVRSILEALERGDYETIRILGHSMKGSGGGYGFDAITDIGRSLEQAAKNRDTEEIRKWIDELLIYLDSVEIIYE